MQMMYETVYKALVEAGLEDAFSPQDYLNFFCLGNREAMDNFDNSASGSPSGPNTPQVSIHYPNYHLSSCYWFIVEGYCLIHFFLVKRFRPPDIFKKGKSLLKSLFPHKLFFFSFFHYGQICGFT